MDIEIKGKVLFTDEVGTILRALYQVGFFHYGLLAGSWVMQIYKEIFGLSYSLRTFDLDFAVSEVKPRSPIHLDLENVFRELDYVVITDYPSGLRKFVKKGFEIEFLVHRKGSEKWGKIDIKHLNVTALPLPFIDVLFNSPIMVDLGEYKVRIPCPEALFIHKLIVAQRRLNEVKKENDLAQCRIIAGSVDSKMLLQIMDTLKLSRKTRANIIASCKAIEFPPQMLDI